MKRNLLVVMFAAVLSGSLNVSMIPAARASGDGGCSLASVVGTFGFTYSGVAIPPTGPVPVAAVGRFRTDAAGDFVGEESNNAGGGSTNETLQGSITVKHDCSGSLVANVYEHGTLVRTSYIHIQYENNANEILAIFQKITLPDGSNLPVVITIDGKRIVQGN